jgi:hypothetical protein
MQTRRRRTAPTGQRALRTAGLARVEGFALAGVVLVVLLVSVPWIDALARSDNETDAVNLVRALGEAAAEHGELALGELVARDALLRRRFADLEVLDGGERLRCHGFLFDRVASPVLLVPTSAPGNAARDLVAWPWEHGRTGRPAFVYTAEGRLLVHGNAEGRFQGPAHPPRGPWGDGWEALAP